MASRDLLEKHLWMQASVLAAALHCRLMCDLMATYKFLRGDHQDLGERLFTRAPQGTTRSNGHKLLQDHFRLDIRKNFFAVRAPEVWNSLPAEVVQAPTLNTFKSKLDAYLAGIL